MQYLHVMASQHNWYLTMAHHFKGQEFKQNMMAMGIKHATSTPLLPQGNAEPEAFMKPLGKFLRAAHLEQRPWLQELSKFLFNYRQTPHSVTKTPLPNYYSTAIRKASSLQSNQN